MGFFFFFLKPTNEINAEYAVVPCGVPNVCKKSRSSSRISVNRRTVVTECGSTVVFKLFFSNRVLHKITMYIVHVSAAYNFSNVFFFCFCFYVIIRIKSDKIMEKKNNKLCSNRMAVRGLKTTGAVMCNLYHTRYDDTGKKPNIFK